MCLEAGLLDTLNCWRSPCWRSHFFQGGGTPSGPETSNRFPQGWLSSSWALKLAAPLCNSHLFKGKVHRELGGVRRARPAGLVAHKGFHVPGASDSLMGGRAGQLGLCVLASARLQMQKHGPPRAH